MIEQATCKNCQTRIPLETTGGLCPSCLLAGAIETGRSEAANAETYDSSANVAQVNHATEAKQFGNYEVIEEIARGGMGVVYKARDRELDRTVALKMILGGQLASEHEVQRFRQEATAAANLDHSGIVPIYEIGEHEGQHFFAMKLIEGGSLADRIEEFRADPRTAATLLAKIARAVQYAHQRGILHRDIKPANVLIDEERNPLITDLGLAKQVESKSGLTQTGAVVGTPAYMPPEQAAGDKDVTTSADIYALGAIMYELLTGQPPHTGVTPMAVLMKVMNEEPAPPRSTDRNINRTLEVICLKCLERDPAKRYTAAAALADDLESWLAGRAVSVRPPSIAVKVGGAILDNVRSAIGAAVTGTVFGFMLALCVGECLHDGSTLSNPPSEIYALLPGKMPSGHDMFHLSETRERGPAGWLGLGAIVLSIGLVVALVTRPKPGAAPLAMAVVAALLMTFTTFVFQIAPQSIGQCLEQTVGGHLETLTEIAVGTEEQAASAKVRLGEEFTTLDQIDASERAEKLQLRIYYETWLSMPVFIVLGVIGSGALCFLPCVIGTLFASKVLNESGQVHRVFIPYCEFMGMAFLVFVTVLFFLANATEVLKFNGTQTSFFWLCILAVELGLMTIFTVLLFRRQLSWKVRLACHFFLILGLLMTLFMMIASFD